MKFGLSFQRAKQIQSNINTILNLIENLSWGLGILELNTNLIELILKSFLFKIEPLQNRGDNLSVGQNLNDFLMEHIETNNGSL